MDGVAPQTLSAAVGRFLAAEQVEVRRLTKSGQRSFDARSAVLRAEVVDLPAGESGGAPGTPISASSGEAACAILELVVRHTTPAVRPDDVLAALRVVADLAPPSPPVATRLAQGPLDQGDGTVADPLAADRTAAAPDA